MISKTYLSLFPSDLATYGRDAKALLKELQSQNERMFLVTFLVLNTGRTEQELENNVFQASSIAQKHNCNLCRLDFQQEQGLMSSLPLADCPIEIQRGLTTSSTAIFIPFTTQELYQSGKESLYYGLNALSNNLIMVDRKKLKNPNGLILGTPGSGKSFSAKREITNAFLVTDDDIIVNDPEGEYSPLVNRLKGQVIKISPNSTQFINPMDINANYSEEDNPLSLKADFILSLCELVVGGKEGLLPVEKTVIDRCVHLVYRRYFADPCPENMPILEDLYNALLQQDEKEAHHVATALEIYVNGSENMIIHGDNLEALKALLPQYEGKVKCIYIDPPYNTGNEGWCYNDNVSDPHIQKWLGEVVGKEGEDLTRHDKWLCMMYPRLMLLQKLLADDGVIFISIDDREQIMPSTTQPSTSATGIPSLLNILPRNVLKESTTMLPYPMPRRNLCG